MAVTLADGSTFDSRYRIQKLLGAGGMGSVYLATDMELNRQVAIKLLNVSSSRTSAEDQERFHREGRALSKLAHPNIISVFRLGLWQNEQPYLVMEYFGGESLNAHILKHGDLSKEQALQVAIAVCEGLSYAHKNGIIHRDIKPHNLLVSEDLNTVKLVDFGLCSVQANSPEEQLKLTITGNLLGTAAYMAPEFPQGEPITAAVDIYSLGCVLHELLTNRQLFDGVLDVPGLIYLHCNGKVPSLRQKCPNILWTEQLESALQHCLSKHGKERPSAETLKSTLESILNSGKITDSKPVGFSLAAFNRRSKSTFLVALFFLFAAFCSLSFLQNWRNSPNDTSWRLQKRETAYSLLVRSDLLMKKGSSSVKSRIAILKQILELPANASEKIEALSRISRLYRAMGDNHKALKYAKKMEPLCNELHSEKKNKLELIYLSEYALDLLDVGPASETISVCKQGIKLASPLENSPFRTEILSSFYQVLSDAYKQTKDTQEAYAALEKAISIIEKKVIETTHWSSTHNATYVKKIVFLIELHKAVELDEEIFRLEELVRKSCSDTEAWLTLQNAIVEKLISMGQNDRAKKCLDRSRTIIHEFKIARSAEDDGLMNIYFILLSASGNQKAATAAAKESIRVLSASESEESVSLLTQLGYNALGQKQYALSQEALMQARRICANSANAGSPDRYLPSRDLAMLFTATGELAKAKLFLEEANRYLSQNRDSNSETRENMVKAWSDYEKALAKK